MALNFIITAVFFITGTSSSGKTTLIPYLKEKLSEEKFVVYDFDEVGVPANADKLWRKNTTEYWLIKAQENRAQGKSTIVCGVSVPSEIIDCSTRDNLLIYFGFININDETIKTRLHLRGWNEQLIQDNINWAHYLQIETEQQKDHLIVEGDNKTPEEIAEVFTKWIETKIKSHKK